jgi:hypothetical protein
MKVIVSLTSFEVVVFILVDLATFLPVGRYRIWQIHRIHNTIPVTMSSSEVFI